MAAIAPAALPQSTPPAHELSFQDLRKILAHRFPMLMLDRVVALDPGRRIVAVKNVTGNEIHFLGHFPEIPIMPGVLIIEALAQTLHVLDALSRDEAPSTGQIPLKYLASANITFSKPVIPGDRLLLEVELVKLMERGVVGRAVARVEADSVAKGELVLMIDRSKGAQR